MKTTQATKAAVLLKQQKVLTAWGFLFRAVRQSNISVLPLSQLYQGHNINESSTYQETMHLEFFLIVALNLEVVGKKSKPLLEFPPISFKVSNATKINVLFVTSGVSG
ncbi:uncharacterized protein ZBAI_04717 [Zygosaccharomyces bailii ISA1307]|nr:uncharacterized protein ZBAI_04717 [Zygosaccharomyces bailii ISA1307]